MCLLLITKKCEWLCFLSLCLKTIQLKESPNLLAENLEYTIATVLEKCVHGFKSGTDVTGLIDHFLIGFTSAP